MSWSTRSHPALPEARRDVKPRVGPLGGRLGEEHVPAAVRLRRHQTGPAQDVGEERGNGPGLPEGCVPPGDRAVPVRSTRVVHGQVGDGPLFPGAVGERGREGGPRGLDGGGQVGQGCDLLGHEAPPDVGGGVTGGGLVLGLVGARARLGGHRDGLDAQAVVGGLIRQNRGDGDPGSRAVGNEFEGAAVGVDDPHPVRGAVCFGALGAELLGNRMRERLKAGGGGQIHDGGLLRARGEWGGLVRRGAAQARASLCPVPLAGGYGRSASR
ncbi:hypothetical protein [Streptomyces hokutonensis]|uniref:hypothetical protein n=1 Tax=Streptomyces hokutonensis TaxID=1306990 RepID=UPI0037F4C1EC